MQQDMSLVVTVYAVVLAPKRVVVKSSALGLGLQGLYSATNFADNILGRNSSKSK